ncbi:MAG: hypothetical protein MOB07_26280, partial [Acidobacteria bacterium]|nr:hypothetical protein [Acidobacteriota bacterium]
MTAEEIEQTLQRVAVAIEQLMQAAVRADERQDTSDSAHQVADERLNALIDAQIGHESRQARLEESHQLLVRLARIQEERIDGHDTARREADERFNALINAQVRYEARQESLEEAFRQVA